LTRSAGEAGDGGRELGDRVLDDLGHRLDRLDPTGDLTGERDAAFMSPPK
jgi:hypothetical protein